METLADMYAKQVAKSRVKFTSGRSLNQRGSNFKGQSLGQGEDENGGSFSSSFSSGLGKKLGRNLFSYLSDSNLPVYSAENPIPSDIGLETYSAENPIPSNLGMTESAGNFAPADVEGYYNSIGVDTGGGEVGGAGGTGNGLAAMAYLLAALKVRGYAGSSNAITDDLGGEEKPWEEKGYAERLTSAPAVDAPLPGLTLLSRFTSGGDPNSSNFFTKLYNFMGEGESKALTPLYSIFVKGPAMDQSNNSLMGWGD